MVLVLGATPALAQKAPAKKDAAAAEREAREAHEAELDARLKADEETAKAQAERQKADEERLDAQDKRIAADEQTIAAQKETITGLDGQLAAEKSARAADERALDEGRKAVAATPPAVRTAWPGIGLTGFAQVDLAFRQRSQDQLVDSTGDPINEDRFVLRRGRLRFTADDGHASGALELDVNTVNGSQARVVGAEVSYRIPGVLSEDPALAMGTFGLFKIPFGYEVLQSDRDRLFLERTTVMRALFPGEYDLGARAQGGWRFVRWSAAAQNGEPLGEKAFPGRDPNGAKDYAGRVGVDLDAGGGLRVVVGFSALTGTGFHKGTPATKDVLVWRDLNEDGTVEPNEIQVIPGAAATVSQNFDRFAVGGDFRVTWRVPHLGVGELYGEVITASNLDRGVQPADPVASTRDLRELGLYGAVTQELGARWQVGLRYDTYDPDRDANDLKSGATVPSDASFSTLAIAAAARVPHGRLVFEYDHNKNHLGRDLAGAPTNLADDGLWVRGEVQF